jgi:hypothetical protein
LGHELDFLPFPNFQSKCIAAVYNPLDDNFLAISSLHLSPFLFIKIRTTELHQQTILIPVNSQPVPIAVISGSAMIQAMQARVLRRILFSATPVLDLLGTNSVSIVVVTLKISMFPMP